MKNLDKIVCVCLHVIIKESDWKDIQNTLLCVPFFPHLAYVFTSRVRNEKVVKNIIK